MNIKKEDYVIYIAGPMTNYPKFNYPAFFAKESELVKLGYKVLNPARNKPKNEDGSKKTWAGYMKDSLDMLEKSTHIYFLDGWEASSGARIENIAALQLGIKIFPITTMNVDLPKATEAGHVFNLKCPKCKAEFTHTYSVNCPPLHFLSECACGHGVDYYVQGVE